MKAFADASQSHMPLLRDYLQRLGVCSVALGYDEGTVVVKIGREEPVASMDSGGKVIWARHNEIQTVNVRSANDGDQEASFNAVPC